MDFLDPKKKRANIIRLYIGYALMSLAILIGTMVILYSSFGYGVDRHTGTVIKNGLLFVSSQPNNASVTLTNDESEEQIKATTNTRMTVPEGNYRVRLNKDGYREWSRYFELDGASVERIMYPLLIPQTITSNDVKTYATQPKLVTNSPDRKWLLVQRPGTLTEFDVYDAGLEAPTPTIRTIPAGVVTSTNGTFEVVEWSNNNKHVLFKHTFDGKTEYILFNHEAPGESLNLNTHLGITPSDVQLFDKSSDQIFALLPTGELQKISLREKKVTPMLTSVVTFKPHGDDMIEYISNEPTVAAKGKVSVRLRTGNADYTIRELPGQTTYLLDIARYDNRWYVVAGAKSENKVYAYEDPLTVLTQKNNSENNRGLIPARTLRAENPVKASFSANAQFISVQGGQEFTVYDIETGRMYRYEINAPLDPAFPATWIDGHRLTTVSNEQSVLFDFDGSNLQTLTGAQTGTIARFDRDYTAYYSLKKTDDSSTFVVTRSKLTVD